MKIEHDMLMIIYGGVIGIVSSIITTLFNTWLERQNEKRKQKEEEDKQKRKIYIPSIGEIIQINKSDEIRRSYLSPLLMVLAIVLSFVCLFLVLEYVAFIQFDSIDISIVWLIAAGFLTFIFARIMLKRWIKK